MAWTPTELARLVLARVWWASRSLATRQRASSAHSTDRISDLRREIASLQDTGIDSQLTTTLWTKRRVELRRIVLERDPLSFLCWNPIIDTMTFDRVPWIRIEYRELRRASDWRDRWRLALAESRIGLPMPWPLYPRSSATLIHHAYHVHRFEQRTLHALSHFDRIVEFGGGYGSMLRLAARLGFQGGFHIHDLPEFNALQRFYWESVREELVAGDPNLEFPRATFAARVDEVPVTGGTGNRSLFVATWSLSETPVALRAQWRATMDRFRFFLFGFQSSFEGIDNVAWFRDYASARPDIDWHYEPIVHRPGKMYLFGQPGLSDGEATKSYADASR